MGNGGYSGCTNPSYEEVFSYALKPSLRFSGATTISVASLTWSRVYEFGSVKDTFQAVFRERSDLQISITSLGPGSLLGCVPPANPPTTKLCEATNHLVPRKLCVELGSADLAQGRFTHRPPVAFKPVKNSTFSIIRNSSKKQHKICFPSKLRKYETVTRQVGCNG